MLRGAGHVGKLTIVRACVCVSECSCPERREREGAPKRCNYDCEKSQARLLKVPSAEQHVSVMRDSTTKGKRVKLIRRGVARRCFVTLL